MYRLSASIIGSLLFLSSFAQILDTSSTHRYKPAKIYAFSEGGLSHLKIDSQALDTSLFGFYNSYPAYRNSFPFLDMGYEGSPLLKISGTQQGYSSLDLGVDALEHYFYSDTITSHITDQPLTRLNYSQGRQELIFIEAQHAQQISDRLTFGVDYRRIKNQNIYYSNIISPENRRFANLFNTKFYTGYYSKDRSYELLFSYLWNKNTNIETGGIEDPVAFNNLSGRAKEDNNAVQLISAENALSQNSFKLVQFFRLAKSPVDTNDPGNLNRFRAQFIWTSQLNSRRLEYRDDLADSAYYNIVMPSEYHDSIMHRTVLNSLNLMIKLGTVDLLAGMEHRYESVYMNGERETFNNVFATGDMNWDYKGVGLGASGRFGLLGYNLGDYFLKFKAKAKLGPYALDAHLHSSLSEAAYMAQKLYSYPRTWDNDLNKVSINTLGAKISWDQKIHQLSARVNISNLFNQIYYTPEGERFQNDASVQHIQSGIQYDFLWPALSFRLALINQQVTDQSVMPRPEWSAQSALYSNFKLFKKALIMQFGLESWWYSNYNMPVYVPYLRQWAVSNTEYSSYAPIQVFLNAKVRSFNFGVTYFHVQEGLMGEDFYSSPLYPMMPRTLRLNIRWDLRN